VRKEWLLQMRALPQLTAVLVFGAAALLLFSFAVGPNYELLRANAPGFLWLALLLSSTLTLAESFQAEMEHRALEGQLLVPVPAAAIYYGKVIANWAQLTLLGVALVPLMVALYDSSLPRPAALGGVVALGALGLSAPGTLYAAMTHQARSRQTLLPLLLFPLVVPVLIASVKATSLLMHGDPMGQLRPWALLLACFAAIHSIVCGLLFGHVVED
jgi:heme exporter protein B